MLLTRNKITTRTFEDPIGQIFALDYSVGSDFQEIKGNTSPFFQPNGWSNQVDTITYHAKPIDIILNKFEKIITTITHTIWCPYNSPFGPNCQTSQSDQFDSLRQSRITK